MLMLDFEVWVGEKLLSFGGSLPVSPGLPAELSDLDRENLKLGIQNIHRMSNEWIQINAGE